MLGTTWRGLRCCHRLRGFASQQRTAGLAPRLLTGVPCVWVASWPGPSGGRGIWKLGVTSGAVGFPLSLGTHRLGSLPFPLSRLFQYSHQLGNPPGCRPAQRLNSRHHKHACAFFSVSSLADVCTNGGDRAGGREEHSGYWACQGGS